MEDIPVLNLNLPINVRAVTVIKNEGEYYIIINRNYDEKEKMEILNEELEKIKFRNND